MYIDAMRGRKDVEFAKAGYKEALERGDRDEQARWANQVGHACKERGQYVEALKWFRLDYDISTKRKNVGASPPGNLMPTCQSMGEIYLRLNDFEQALIFQRKHFHLAEETDNLVEQQRASTQLGRTYLEIYEQKDDFSAFENAKEFFKVSMEIARTLKENPPSRDSPSFVKELVDAYNNMGLLMMVIDDHKQAVSLFEQGLRICNEEELGENDDARSRLHHNLGRLYSERRDWEKAKYHTQTDISICQRIPHPQGEAKGFINLGELHFKRQRYEEATRCYERALTIAQSLEDEDDLVSTAQKNLDVVCEAEEKLLKLTVGEQQLKKFQRKKLVETNVKARHRAEEYKLLNELIGLAEYLQAWDKHLKLAKNLKAVVKEMGDMEKLGDAMETMGESYYSLRIFPKAKKWMLRSFDLCKRIGHLEGQSVAMINYGNVLDSIEDWEQALKAYKNAYEIARSQGRTRMLPQQISALENMQYCYLVRLKSTADAKAIQSKVQGLKELKDKQDAVSGEDEHCSETDNESEYPLTATRSGDNATLKKQKPKAKMHSIIADFCDDDAVLVEDEHCLETDNESEYPLTAKRSGDKATLKKRKPKVKTPSINADFSDNDDDIDAPLAAVLPANCLQIDDDAPVASVLPANHVRRNNSKDSAKKVQVQKSTETLGDMLGKDVRCPEKDARSLNPCNQERRSRKRPRVVLLDEEEIQESEVAADIGSETHASAKANGCSGLREERDDTISPYMDLTAVHVMSDQLETSEMESAKSGNLNPVHDEGVAMKFTNPSELQNLLKDQKRNLTVDDNKNALTFVGETDSISDQVPEYATVQMGDQVIKINLQKQNKDQLSVKTIDWLKNEIVETYGFSNPAALKPLLWHVVLNGRILQPSETLNSALADYHASDTLEAIVDCWVPVPLMERYQLFCKLYQQIINVKLMNCLGESKVLEDKICASECNLDDNSAWPLLMALSGNGSFSHLDLSHNSLGSRSVHKIQELIAASNQPNLGLNLDLHSNHLGAASIAQVCECPVTLSRLEVLNLSGNKLTDAAARFITNLIKNSQALEVLKLENCSLTTRSISKISAVLHSSCPLVKLSIGKNNPISSLAIAGLLEKLSCLSNFSELDLTGISLDKQGLEGLGRLLKSSQTMSTLVLGECYIQNEGALGISHAVCACDRMIVKLDISFCGLENDVYEKLCPQVGSLRSLSFLNLSGNKLGEKGALQMAAVLSSSECRLKTLLLKRCHLGWSGILIILNSIQGNSTLHQLTLGENNLPKDREVMFETTMGEATFLDHKLEPKTPINGIVTQGLKSYREHCGTFVGAETAGNVGSPTAEGCEHSLSTNKNNSDHNAKTSGGETEGVSSSNWNSKGVGVGVVSDSEDDGEDEQSTIQLDDSGLKTPTTKDIANLRVDCLSRNQVVAMTVMDSMAVDAFARALAHNEGLKFLDVSDNGLTSASADKLFSAWVASTRWAHQPKRHTTDRIIHFTVDNEECCGRPPCCDIG